ncbi:DUF3592 domain-containing protein [Actinoplanes flavus]|uniref:DUF3592 domain-containing protein n=1 Tax=Actinoplanes flavus TaxID=2820290 RepID=A0ABS3USG0_9ACTN|nr:DUF3592 domain-containing protein [Actinoplanes flavus]MBO3741506.1 hypothetical protein [Actinoplanes flavus]
MAQPPRSRTFLRIFFTLGLSLALTGLAGSTWSNLDDARGADADADVMRVDSSGTKRMLTVRFTTAEGQVCEDYLRSRRAEQTRVRVGDVVRIHHPKRYPCNNVREAGNANRWLSTVVAAVLAIVFGIGCFTAWGPPITMPPQRYADAP